MSLEVDGLNKSYALLEVGNRKYHEKDYVGALQLYDQSLKLATEVVDAHELDEGAKMMICTIRNRKAASLHRLQRYNEEISECTEMVKLGYLKKKAFVRLGGAAWALGDFQGAAKAYVSALQEENPNSQDEKVRQYLNELREKAGDGVDIPAPANPSRSKAADRTTAGSVQERNEIYSLQVNATKAMLNEANYDSAIGNFSRALEKSEKVLGRNPQDIGTRITHNALLGQRATALRKMERFEEAIRDAQKMIEIAPTSERSYFRKAQVYLGMAQTTLEEAVRQCPQSADVLRASLSSVEVLMESLSHINMMTRQLDEQRNRSSSS